MKVMMKNGVIKESSFKEEVGRDALRQTAAHVLAQGVKRIYPASKYAYGVVTENGFYYDFDMGIDLSMDRLPELEGEMSLTN